jgi:hypothetical protein
MRALTAVSVLSLLVAGCTPAIPVKDSFGTSTLVPAGKIPPEFAEFNAYDPAINPLLAEQICATPYQPLVDKSVEAMPGKFVHAIGRCQTHVPMFGELPGWY